MTAIQPRYSKEVFAQRGDIIYDRDLRPLVGPENEGIIVAIDIETGAYEIDADELVASDRLRARIPDAQIWLRRIGSRYVRRFGPRPRPGAPRSPGWSLPIASRSSACACSARPVRSRRSTP